MRILLILCVLVVGLGQSLRAQTDDKTYYPDGQVRTEGGLDEQERLHGKWVFYHPNGQKHREGSFSHGQALGTWREWYENGQLKSSVSFVLAGGEAVKNGSYRMYHPNGKVARSGSYSYGRKIGTWKEYDENGKRVIQEETESEEEAGADSEEESSPE